MRRQNPATYKRRQNGGRWFALAIALIFGMIALAFLIQKFRENYFEYGATIQGVNCSSLTVEEAAQRIEKEINKNGVTYKLKDISEQENKKTISKNKEIEKELIVKTTNKYDVLNMFKQEINIKENGYTGTLKINNLSLKIEENDTYKEEYKVYYEEKYENVKIFKKLIH